MNAGKRLGILVGGGPAPGINTVISSAAIEAINEGFEVIGIQDGFKNLVRRNADKLRPLAIDDVSRVHLAGGSVLGTSRENPTKSPEALQAVIETLQQAGITHLVTIGGDDTALSSRTVAERSQGTIRSVHVPKTIDNDLPLPPHVPTFGFQTARHVGVELVRNLMEDAKPTRRWYVVVAMGRKAGHLALGHRQGRRRDADASSPRSSPTRPCPSPTSATSSRARSSSAGRWAATSASPSWPRG